jgi:predicted TPR repeat methyltransferase
MHRDMAVRLEREGFYEHGAQSYRDALEIAPELVDAHVGLGTCLRLLDRPEEARAAFEDALALEHGSVEANFALANLLRARGDLAESAERYRRVLAAAPEHAEARYFLSVVTPGETPESIPDSLVRDLFDSYADSFESHLVDRLGYRGPEILRGSVGSTIDFVGLTVVDLGCGTGLCGPPFRDLAERLIGVDLSPRMLEKARERDVYDELRVEDLSTTLRSGSDLFDLAVAAEVLGYVGELKPLFRDCAGALRRGGRFAFTAEQADEGESFVLLRGGRFAHGRGYLEERAADAGFEIECYAEAVIRTEDGQPVRSHVYVLRV